MKSKVISFVSFKGGSGRTVALANVAFQLAKKARVGCIDFDIEAGSLNEMFNITARNKDSIQHFMISNASYEKFIDPDVPDYIKDAATFEKRLVIKVRDYTDGELKNAEGLTGEIFMIQAEADAVLNSLVDTGNDMFYRSHKLTECFSENLNLDYVLIDCRSGISNLGLPGLAYCDTTVVFMKWGRQHAYGTERFINWYSNWLKKARLKKDIYLAVTGVEEAKYNEVSIYCKEKLKLEENQYIIIPEIRELYHNEIIFCTSEYSEEQKAYIKLSEIIQKAVE